MGFKKRKKEKGKTRKRRKKKMIPAQVNMEFINEEYLRNDDIPALP